MRVKVNLIVSFETDINVEVATSVLEQEYITALNDTDGDILNDIIANDDVTFKSTVTKLSDD